MVGKAGDLSLVGNAENLRLPRQAVSRRRPTASAIRPPMPASISSKMKVGTARRAALEPLRKPFAANDGLKRQHQAGELATRRDLFERARAPLRIGRRCGTRRRQFPARRRRLCARQGSCPPPPAGQNESGSGLSPCRAQPTLPGRASRVLGRLAAFGGKLARGLLVIGQSLLQLAGHFTTALVRMFQF